VGVSWYFGFKVLSGAKSPKVGERALALALTLAPMLALSLT